MKAIALLILTLCLLACLPGWAESAPIATGSIPTGPVLTDRLAAPVEAAPVATLARGQNTIALGQTTYFTVPGLQCGEDAQKKQLWLDGMDTGVRSIGCNDVTHLLSFNLERFGAATTAQSDKAWLTLLRNPFARTDKKFERPVDVVILNGDGSRAASATMRLRLLDGQRLWLGALILLGVFGLLGYGILESGLVRDSGTPPAGTRRPFSLARVQMVWWFAIVFFSYVLLWLVMQDLPGIPATVLGLIGLAGGTALAAAAVDKSSGEPLVASQGFWIDIATDAHGITLPRVQQIAWTFLFGFVFLTKVFYGLAMPDFDNSVLALMGISAGTYLGFKVPETHVKTDAPEGGAETDDGKSGYTPVPASTSQ